MRNILLKWLSVLLLVAPFYSANSAPCEPNPVFSAFPGEQTNGSCDRSRFTSLDMVRWKNPDSQKGGVEYFKVEGEYWYYFVDIAKDAKGLYPGKLEVQRNFENAVRQAKGTVLYRNDNSKVYYRIKRNDGEYWGEAGCGRGDATTCDAIMHKIVRVEAMEQSVVVSAAQIAKSIADEGKVIFYGLYFDTDKAVLKPESAPTLAEMAKWLKDNATTHVYIVGHTDMQGSVTHNQALSRSRAGAVVEALIKQHDIKPERLAAEGVGPYAPMSNNTSEAGRAKNRRVEMVLR